MPTKIFEYIRNVMWHTFVVFEKLKFYVKVSCRLDMDFQFHITFLIRFMYVR